MPETLYSSSRTSLIPAHFCTCARLPDKLLAACLMLPTCRFAPTRQVATAAGAKAGDYVAVQYTGTLTDGTVFDTSRKEGRDPLEFIVGAGRVSSSSSSC